MAGKPLQLFCLFLSTLSLRRATPHHAGRGCNAEISIHALLAESDRNDTSGPAGRCISIHALLAESDHNTPSDFCSRGEISIHALLAESDLFALLCNLLHHHFYPRSPCGERLSLLCRILFRRYFYPRSPCGERRKPKALKSRLCVFLSTLSLRRATNTFHKKGQANNISIHALLAESDSWRRVMIPLCLYFYPRSPCGERQGAAVGH